MRSARHGQTDQHQGCRSLSKRPADRKCRATLTSQRRTQVGGKPMTGQIPSRSRTGGAEPGVDDNTPGRFQHQRGSLQRATSRHDSLRCRKLRAILALLHRCRGFGQITFESFQQAHAGGRQHHRGHDNRADVRWAQHRTSKSSDRDHRASKEGHVSPELMTEGCSSIHRES